MLPEIWRNKGSLLSPSFDDFVERFFYGWPTLERDADYTWSPRVDISESEKEINLDVELPGLDKKDIKVEVKDNTLTISGERTSERKSEDARCCRTERHYGRFERSFGLPDTVKGDKVSAEYKNGVLTLKLPKTVKAIPKEVQIAIK